MAHRSPYWRKGNIICKRSSLPVRVDYTRVQLKLKCSCLRNLLTRILYWFVQQMGYSLPVNQLAFSVCAVCIELLNYLLHLLTDKFLHVGKQKEQSCKLLPLILTIIHFLFNISFWIGFSHNQFQWYISTSIFIEELYGLQRGSASNMHPEVFTDENSLCEVPETAEGDAGVGVFECPSEGCTKVYQKYSVLEKHLSYVKCEMFPESTTLLDQTKEMYHLKLTEGRSTGVKSHDERTVPREVAANTNQLARGWALKQTKKSGCLS